MDGAEDQANERNDQQHQTELAYKTFRHIAAEVEKSERCGEQEKRIRQHKAAAQDVTEDVFDDSSYGLRIS